MNINLNHINEIIKGLYLGNLYIANDIDALKNLGITKVFQS